MDTEGSISPREAARLIGVHPNSIRAWCDRFGEFLSDTAKPRPKEARRLTPEDVARLARIHKLSAKKKTFEEIAGILRDLWPEESSGPVVPSTAVQNVPEPPSALVPASAVVQALDVRLAALQRLLDAPPAAQALQNARAQGFAAGVTAAIAIMLALALLIGVLASLGVGWLVRLLGGG